MEKEMPECRLPQDNLFLHIKQAEVGHLVRLQTLDLKIGLGGDWFTVKVDFEDFNRIFEVNSLFSFVDVFLTVFHCNKFWC